MARDVEISVIVISWNTRELLRQTLESLYAHTNNVSFEVIVVDNASTDGSADLISSQFRSVLLLRLPENKGFAHGNNQAFALASAPFILLLNSDTIVHWNTLSELLRVLQKQSSLGCVGPKHINGDGSLQRSCDSFPSMAKDVVCYSELRRLRFIERYLGRNHAWWGDHSSIQIVDWVNGSCMLVRREVIALVGGLDEGYRLYAEEIDWCYRMRQAGWFTCFTPEACITHLGGQSTKKLRSGRLVLLYESQFRFYRIHYKRLYYLCFRLVILLVVSFRLCIVALISLFASGGLSSLCSRENWTQEPEYLDDKEIIGTWKRIVLLPW